jgi:mitochondrial fission protein ELM1
MLLVRALIISDKSPGHFNQSIAFCKHLRAEYDILEVSFKASFLKLFSYILARFGIFLDILFNEYDLPNKEYDFVVASGSKTYYFALFIAKKLGIKSISLMYPSGFAKEFDTIFAQSHDNIKEAKNIIKIDVNFSYIEPKGVFKPKEDERYVSVIIGGDDDTFTLKKEQIKSYFDYIFDRFKEYKILVTTSPRTSKEIESLVEEYPFFYKLIYSKQKANPIPDFLSCSEVVFITMDSTSMISEAVSYGKSSVVVLPIEKKGGVDKFDRMIEILKQKQMLEIFSKDLKFQKNKKFDFSEVLEKICIKR